MAKEKTMEEGGDIVAKYIYGGVKDERKYALKEDFVIKAGTVLDVAPTVTRTGAGVHREAVIGIGNDACAFLRVCVDESPDVAKLFEVVES